MSSDITLRIAQRSDIPALSRIANAANGKSALHKRMAPWEHQYPLAHYYWRVNIIRERFAVPNLRIVVAEDSSSGEILGFACWTIEGSNTDLYKIWSSEHTWSDWLEGKLVSIERWWSRYALDKSIDYAFMDDFMAAFQGAKKHARPDCLSVHQIVVDPSVQARGVGRKLIDWGKELAVEENLPVFLESNLEATGFYEKGGFSRMNEDFWVRPEGQEPFCIPVYVWEGKEREGQWLERDESCSGDGVRWRWREDIELK